MSSTRNGVPRSANGPPVVSPAANGPMPKYGEAMSELVQVKLPVRHKQWLLDQRTPEKSMSDIVRELIDGAIQRQQKARR